MGPPGTEGVLAALMEQERPSGMVPVPAPQTPRHALETVIDGVVRPIHQGRDLFRGEPNGGASKNGLVELRQAGQDEYNLFRGSGHGRRLIGVSDSRHHPRPRHQP